MTMTTLTLIVATALLALAPGETGQALNEAESAYERGNYDECLARLDTAERGDRPSPRTQSMRALALNQLHRPLEAYQSIRLYLRLTEGHGLGTNAAHAELVALGDSLRASLEAERAAKRESLRTEGDAKSAAQEGAVERRFAADAQKRQQAFDAAVTANRHRKILGDAAAAHALRDRKRPECTAASRRCP